MTESINKTFIADDKEGNKYIVLGILNYKLLCQPIKNNVGVGDLKFIDAITLKFIKFYNCSQK